MREAASLCFIELLHYADAIDVKMCELQSEITLYNESTLWGEEEQ